MTARMQQIKQMLVNDPNDSFLLFALAKEYENEGKLQAALEVFLKLESIDPEYVGMYYHLGKLYEAMTMNDEALSAYERGITIAKKQSDFHALSELNTAKTNLEIEM